jgi:hypothetical protein
MPAVGPGLLDVARSLAELELPMLVIRLFSGTSWRPAHRPKPGPHRSATSLNEAAHALRPQEGGRAGGTSAPVETGERRPRQIEHVHEFEDIAASRERGVSVARNPMFGPPHAISRDDRCRNSRSKRV